MSIIQRKKVYFGSLVPYTPVIKSFTIHALLLGFSHAFLARLAIFVHFEPYLGRILRLRYIWGQFRPKTILEAPFGELCEFWPFSRTTDSFLRVGILFSHQCFKNAHTKTPRSHECMNFGALNSPFSHFKCCVCDFLVECMPNNSLPIFVTKERLGIPKKCPHFSFANIQFVPSPKICDTKGSIGKRHEKKIPKAPEKLSKKTIFAATFFLRLANAYLWVKFLLTAGTVVGGNIGRGLIFRTRKRLAFGHLSEMRMSPKNRAPAGHFAAGLPLPGEGRAVTRRPDPGAARR